MVVWDKDGRTDKIPVGGVLEPSLGTSRKKGLFSKAPKGAVGVAMEAARGSSVGAAPGWAMVAKEGAA